LQFNGSLIPTAPADMFMALGKWKIYIILAKKMVVIRMGDVATDNPTFCIIWFWFRLWQKISFVSVICLLRLIKPRIKKINLLVTKK
jgi:hypothetical protein